MYRPFQGHGKVHGQALRPGGGFARAGVFLAAWAVVSALMIPQAVAETIDLRRYLSLVRERHPFFQKEDLTVAIERERQSRFLGDKDWVVRATPEFRHQEPTSIGLVIPDSVETTRVETALERKLWRTGGRLTLAHRYDFSDQQLNDLVIPQPGGDLVLPVGPGKYYENGLSLSYAHPLLKNAGGLLDRLEYEQQGFNAEASTLIVRERQEDFLRDVGIGFLDWALFGEVLRIAEERLHLAEKELKHTRRKLQANLVDKVDVLRARDAVLTARAVLSRARGDWKAKRAEMAAIARDASLNGMEAAVDLYRTPPLPGMEAAVDRIRKDARIVRVLRIRIEQAAHQRAGLASAARPQLDLVVSGSVKGGAETAADANDFDKTDYQVGLAFRYPLGNRAARADVRRADLEHRQALAALDGETVNLEARLRRVMVQLQEFERTLALNREQIKTARQKTREEERLHEKGRTELTFVIQSRDNEAVAQLAYARNAAAYQKLLLQYRAVMDELLPAG